MKIAFIGQKGIPADKGGGVERYVEAVSQQLVELGHQVFAYTRPRYTAKSKRSYQGVNLISLSSIPTKNLDAISHVFLATWHAIFNGYDVIHYQGVGPSLLSFLPRIFSPHTKVVSTFHSLDRNHAKWSWLAKKILHLGEWTACKFPHQTVSVSKMLQEYCVRKYNTPTTYIPNGVYTRQTFNKSVLKDYNLHSKRYFIVASRFVSHKRIEDIIQAFDELNYEDIKLVIAGDSVFTSKYTRQLKRLAEQNENIIFTGFIPGEKLFSLMHYSLAFVSASEDEGMPITVLEALSVGVPVILSDIQGHQELLQQINGLSFELANLDELQSKMQYAVMQKKRLAQQAKQNRIIINQRYDWQEIAQALEKLYAQRIALPKSYPTNLF